MSTVAARVAAGVLLALAIGAALVGAPAPPEGSAASRRQLAEAIAHERDHVTALELAAWIRDRKPGLRVLDLRDDSAFADYHVPSAERVEIERLVDMRFTGGETLVLYSEGGGHAAQAWVLLRGAGVRDVYFLRGGLLEWMDDVMNPVTSSALTRYFGGTARQGPVPAVPMPDEAPAAVRRLRRRSC